MSVSRVSAKSKVLAFLTKTAGHNTFSVRQAQVLFGLANVSATISQLRAEGYAIYTNMKRRGDGSPVAIYRLGRPSAAFSYACRMAGVIPKGN